MVGIVPRRDPIDHATLMAVALDLVDDAGFEALTLSNVAAMLHVGPSALYTHVDGLAGLHHATAVESTRRLAAVVRDAAVGRAGDEAIRSVAREYRAYARRHPGRFTAVVRVAGDEAMADAHAELDGVFVLLSEARGLSGVRAGRAARNARRAIHGFVAVEHATGAADHADRDFRDLIDTLCRMLDT